MLLIYSMFHMHLSGWFPMGLSHHLSNHPWSFSLYIKISTLENYRIGLEVGGSRRIVGGSNSPLNRVP